MAVHITHELHAKLDDGDILQLSPNGNTDISEYKNLFIDINGDGYSMPLEDIPHVVYYLIAFYNARVSKDKHL